MKKKNVIMIFIFFSILNMFLNIFQVKLLVYIGEKHAAKIFKKLKWHVNIINKNYNPRKSNLILSIIAEALEISFNTKKRGEKQKRLRIKSKRKRKTRREKRKREKEDEEKHLQVQAIFSFSFPHFSPSKLCLALDFEAKQMVVWTISALTAPGPPSHPSNQTWLLQF